MSGNFEFWVGNRYVRSRSSNRFVSLISAISMLGIAIAVSVLILVLSVVNGFERELIATTLELILRTAEFAVEDKATAWSALDDYRGRGIDVADNLLGITNRAAGCDCTVTFDRRAAQSQDFQLL